MLYKCYKNLIFLVSINFCQKNLIIIYYHNNIIIIHKNNIIINYNDAYKYIIPFFKYVINISTIKLIYIFADFKIERVEKFIKIRMSNNYTIIINE